MKSNPSSRSQSSSYYRPKIKTSITDLKNNDFELFCNLLSCIEVIIPDQIYESIYNFQDLHGRSALHTCASKKRVVELERLIRAGANVNASDKIENASETLH
jgi:hypothetical protein